MAHIKLPKVDEVDENTKKEFEKYKALTGNLSDLIRILATRQDIMDMTGFMIKTLLQSQTELDIKIKEYIAIVVSLENGCSVCVGEHERVAKMLGMSTEVIDQLKAGFENAALDDAVIKLLRFCVKCSKESYKVIQKDFDELREVGYSDSQLFETVAIVGYYNYINTISNAMGAGGGA
ncbi:MAG: peroxidase-related enzyme, partial [Thermodesulfobacteriota bacterium]